MCRDQQVQAEDLKHIQVTNGVEKLIVQIGEGYHPHRENNIENQCKSNILRELIGVHKYRWLSVLRWVSVKLWMGTFYGMSECRRRNSNGSEMNSDFWIVR